MRFPLDYGRERVLGELRFWAEQYLLQASLTFNSQFEVLILQQLICACLFSRTQSLISLTALGGVE